MLCLQLLIPFPDRIYFLLKLHFIEFFVFALSYFFIINFYIHRHVETVLKDILQIAGDLAGLSLCNNRVRHSQTHSTLPFEAALCLLEHIFLQHTFLLQLKKNTLLVGMHQVLRRILLGKPVFLDNRHRNIPLRKQLFLNLVLHITYRFLRDQMGTVNINLDMISG